MFLWAIVLSTPGTMPILIWVAIPCIGGSPWQNLNKLWPGGDDRIQSHIDTFTPLWLKFVGFIKWVKVEQKRRYVLCIEWPTGCAYWRWHSVQEFERVNALSRTNFHGCAFGLTSRIGNPIKKPWTISTNSVLFQSSVEKRICCNDHFHDVCCGIDTKESENYTFSMTRNVHKCFKSYCTSTRSAAISITNPNFSAFLPPPGLPQFVCTMASSSGTQNNPDAASTNTLICQSNADAVSMVDDGWEGTPKEGANTFNRMSGRSIIGISSEELQKFINDKQINVHDDRLLRDVAVGEHVSLLPEEDDEEPMMKLHNGQYIPVRSSLKYATEEKHEKASMFYQQRVNYGSYSECQRLDGLPDIDRIILRKLLRIVVSQSPVSSDEELLISGILQRARKGRDLPI